jgi:2-(1,2-epoxy-1,2-dihydrophenyl)acetyl-CoA isomerase
MSASEALVTCLIDDNGVATLRLNRPEQGNALSLPLVEALSDLVGNLDVDTSVRCILLTGKGRFFCVGGDVGAFKQAGPGTPALLKRITVFLHMAVARLAQTNKPIVVAVNGPAAGAGLGLATLGDIVLSSRSAHFTMAYTAIGLTPDAGTTWLLPRLIGLRRTQEMTLTNRRVGSEEAAQIGLVTRVVEDEALQVEALAAATTLARGANSAFAAVRRLLLSGADGGLETHLEREARAIADAAAGGEGREGIAAFLEKRKPDFAPGEALD